MATFGPSKEHVFKGYMTLRHSDPSHDTFSTVFQMIDPKALDAAFGQVLAHITALLGEGDVIEIDGKALRARQGRECLHPSGHRALYWQLDVSFRENDAHNRKDNSLANIAILRRCALDVARRDASKGSLSIKLKRAGWDGAFLLKLLNQLDRA